MLTSVQTMKKPRIFSRCLRNCEWFVKIIPYNTGLSNVCMKGLDIYGNNGTNFLLSVAAPAGMFTNLTIGGPLLRI